MNTFELQRILARAGLELVKTENNGRNVGFSPNEAFVRVYNGQSIEPHPELEHRALEHKAGKPRYVTTMDEQGRIIHTKRIPD